MTAVTRHVCRVGAVSVAVLAGACTLEEEPASARQELWGSGSHLDRIVRWIAHDQGLRGSPKLDQPALTADERALVDRRVELGRFLFHDKALGGKKHSSCATCHHPAFHGADGQAIAKGVYCSPHGDRGRFVGPDRRVQIVGESTRAVARAVLRHPSVFVVDNG